MKVDGSDGHFYHTLRGVHSIRGVLRKHCRGTKIMHIFMKFMWLLIVFPIFCKKFEVFVSWSSLGDGCPELPKQAIAE